MSLIGPRPLLVQYLPLYSEKQKHRHDVRPGLSGYAQVNGRNSISSKSFDKKKTKLIIEPGMAVIGAPISYAAINIEPLFMLFLLITAQLNYSRDFDFKDLYNNTCFRKGYKI